MLNRFFFKKRLIAIALSVWASLGMAAPIAEKDLPKNELTGELLYQIIASELALQRNDVSAAYQTYMDVARKTKDPRMAQRAFQIADTVHAFNEAKTASDLWVEFAPKGYEEAAHAQLLSKLRTGKLTDANQHDAIELLKASKTEQARNDLFERIALQAQLGTKDAQKVLAFLLPLTDLCNKKGQAALTLANLYRRTGDKAKATRYSRQAYLDLPDNTTAVLEYADTLIANHPTESVKVLEQFVKKHPQNFEVQLGLAKAYARTKNLEGVKKQLDILDPFADRSAQLNFTLASVSDTVGLMTETKRYLLQFERMATQQSVMVDRLPQTYFSLGLIDYRLKHNEAAIDWLKKVEAKSDYYAQARLLQARALVRLNKIKDAIDLLEDTRAQKEVRAELLQAKAQIYYDSQDKENAYKTLQRALKLAPESATLLSQVAMMALETSHSDEAEKYLREGIAKFPQKADFYNTLGYLYVEASTNLAEAQKLLTQALKLDPESVAIQDSVGWLYFKLGHYDTALQYLEKAASKSSDAEILLHLTELYGAMGQKQKALETLNRVKKVAPNNKDAEALAHRLGLVK